MSGQIAGDAHEHCEHVADQSVAALGEVLEKAKQADEKRPVGRKSKAA
ncbi:hypothetical protein ES703_92285 [subsurface metagenome]